MAEDVRSPAAYAIQDSSERKKKVCFAFQRGSCNRTKCRFAHDGDARKATGNRNRSGVVCFFCDGPHPIRVCKKLKAYKDSVANVETVEAAEEEVQGDEAESAWMLCDEAVETIEVGDDVLVCDDVLACDDVLVCDVQECAPELSEHSPMGEEYSGEVMRYFYYERGGGEKCAFPLVLRKL